MVSPTDAKSGKTVPPAPNKEPSDTKSGKVSKGEKDSKAEKDSKDGKEPTDVPSLKPSQVTIDVHH